MFIALPNGKTVRKTKRICSNINIFDTWLPSSASFFRSLFLCSILRFLSIDKTTRL
jgi:hypothetical protein